MAANITISEQVPYMESRRSDRGSMILKLVGAATGAGDTGTFTTTLIAPDAVLGGAFTFSYVASTGVLTITSIYALGTNTVYVEMVGFPK